MGMNWSSAHKKKYHNELRPIDHMVAYSDAFCAVTGWNMQRIGRLRYLESGIEHSLFNWVYGAPSTLTSQQMKDFINLLGKAPASWLCTTEESPHMQPFLDALPIAHMHQVKGVTFDLSDLVLPDLKDVSDLKIRAVANHNEMRTFDRLSAPTFVHEEGMVMNFMRGLPAKKPNVHKLECYLIEYKGRPVGFFQTYVYEDVLGVYWGGILPEARNRGIGSAALAKTLETTRDQGYKALVAHLLPSSWSLVERFMPQKEELLDFYVLMP